MRRLSERLVDAASLLVPRSERRRFRREWRAELAHRRGEPGARLLRSSLGALPHALWLARQAWRWDAISQDLRYALRTLLHRPGFVVVAAATLAIAIGANTALFSVFDATLLRPLPYGSPERLLALYETNEGVGGTLHGPAPGNVRDWREASATLDAVAAWWVESTTLLGDGGGETEEVPSALVTEDFFTALGVEPLLGRSFTGQEAREGRRVTVLSYELWQRRFGGESGVVGSDVRFKSGAWRVVGVMPAGFRPPWALAGEVQLFKPLDFAREWAHLPEVPRDFRYLRVVGRRTTGSTNAEARAELETVAESLADAFPETNAGWSVALMPLRDAIVGEAKPALVVLLAAVGLLLLLACSNVASLLIVRASGRGLEMAVRTALGASRLRLVRQLFLESFLLAATGGLLGVGLAQASLELLGRFAPPGALRLDSVTLDGRVLAFALLVSGGAGLLAGLLPAFQSSTVQPSAALKGASGAVSSDRRRLRLRAGLVVAEVAISVLLLVSMALFLRSLDRVLSVEPGFDPDGLLVARMRLDRDVYGGGGAHPYYTALLERLHALPGVVAVGGTTGLPMDEVDIDFDRPVWRDGEPRPAGGGAGAQIRMATVGYFETMRIPLVAGRTFDGHDDRTGPPVVLVNETLERQMWPDEGAVGRRVRIDYLGRQAAYDIVGVVGDTRFYGHKAAPRPAIYLPHAQNPYLPLNVVIRASGDATALGPAVRGAVLDLDPNQPVHSMARLEDLMGGYVGRDRFAAFLMTAFAVIALLLSTVGLYGIVAEGVGQRRRELGLRMALGADGSSIAALVLLGGVKLAAVGALVGLAAALASGRYLEGLLFGVSATDPIALASALGLATATVLLACYLPARRAARVDPTTSLRAD